MRQLVEVVHQQDRVEAGTVSGLRLGRDGVEQLGWVDAGIGEVRDLVAEAGHGPIVARDWWKGFAWLSPSTCWGTQSPKPQSGSAGWSAHSTS